MAVSKNFCRLTCIAFVTFCLLQGRFGSASEEENSPEILTPKFVELEDLSIEEFCEGCKEFVGEIDKQLDDPVTRTDKELTVYLNEVCEELDGWASSKALKVCHSIMSVGGAQDNLHSILKAATDSSPKMICHDLFNVCHKKDPSFKNSTAGLEEKKAKKDGMREISQEEYAEMQANEGPAGGQNGTSKPEAVSVNEYCEGCKLLMQEVNNQLDIVETRTLKEVQTHCPNTSASARTVTTGDLPRPYHCWNSNLCRLLEIYPLCFHSRESSGCTVSAIGALFTPEVLV
ncbi:hypothetical protein CYMTET_52284 [Cymbomonas tetramitiformis]|uniref:Saposin B-type domain-containing protein n=1 Tax=Cymbomonas tetramitiformis TaxID=36881 RepID=A0AAE0BJA2_9CHLO|nr:hypothetical protein CYMTET_52284 [Cymbomonas tetramitiformis]